MKLNYFNTKTVASDTIAGLALGIESIPVGLAPALLAAVNPVRGVYAVVLAEARCFSQGVLKDNDQVQVYGRDNFFMATEFTGKYSNLPFTRPKNG